MRLLTGLYFILAGLPWAINVRHFESRFLEPAVISPVYLFRLTVSMLSLRFCDTKPQASALRYAIADLSLICNIGLKYRF